jgi:ferredoxin
VDGDVCLACGLCADHCPVEAIAVEELAEVNAMQCIGCGVCVTQCPEGALALVRRETTYEPPKDHAAWLMQVAAEKGREEAFTAQMG